MSTTEVTRSQRAGGTVAQTGPPPERRAGLLADAEIEALLPDVDLLESDGQNMESDLHRLCMELLLSSIANHFRGRDDYYAAGNSFIYFSTEQARHQDFKGPDFYLVKNVPHDPIRPYWAVWNEGGRYPDVIIELLSPTTRQNDLTTKKDIYEQTFHTGNYFCFDPQTKELFGWKYERAGYVELPPQDNGRLWCDELNLWLGPWEGDFSGFKQTWLRFFTPDGRVVPVPSELAEAATSRAEAAEAELARLKKLMAAKGIVP
jgi:Uma2 family endonuclease